MSVLKVYQNGVDLGSITKEDYNKIVNDVNNNKMFILLQFSNVLDVILKVLLSVLKESILFFVLFFVSMILLSPESFSEIFSIPDDQRIEFALTVRKVLLVAICFSAISLGVKMIVWQEQFFRSFGFKNIKKYEIEKKLAILVGTVIDKDLTVVPVKSYE